jgi:hypothetical protein
MGTCVMTGRNYWQEGENKLAIPANWHDRMALLCIYCTNVGVTPVSDLFQCYLKKGNLSWVKSQLCFHWPETMVEIANNQPRLTMNQNR